MTFPALREALVAAGRNPLSVTCADYDSAETVSRAPSDAWKLRHHDGVWDVGAAERGHFVLDSRLETESEACALLARILLVGHPVQHQTPEQRVAAEAITRDASARARERIAAMKRDQQS